MRRRRIERAFERFRRTGEPGALADVFDATAPELLRVAGHWAPNAAAAEDLLQKTFVSAIESAATWERSRRLLPWLVGILKNHARAESRAAKRTVDPARLISRADAEPVDVAAWKDDLGEALRAIDALSDPARSILILRYRHGLEPAEIAITLGMAPATVRSHLHRGIERVRAARANAGVAFGIAASPTRGLEGVRSAVLAEAARAGAVLAASAGAAAAAATVVMGGALVGKKVLGLGLVAAIAGGGAALWSEVTSERIAKRDVARVAPMTTGAQTAGALAGRADAAGAEEATPAAGARSDLGALEVRILSSAGDPVPRAPFWMRDVYAQGPTVPLHHVTDEQGRARVEALRPQRYFVRSAHGKGAYVEVRAGEVAQAELRHDEGTDVVGTVIDEHGSPVANAEIWVDTEGTRSYGMVLVARADEQGRFRIDDLSASTIGARAKGHAPSPCHRLGSARGTREITLIVGTKGAAVRGRVVDGAGAPVSGAVVLVGAHFGMPKSLHDGTQGEIALPVLLVTVRDGSFAAEGLARGKTFVTVRAPGQGALREERELLGTAPADEWTITLPSERVLEGVVVNALGRAAPRATVTTDTLRDPLWSWSTTTDAEGHFRIEDLGPSPLSLRVLHEAMGYGAASVPAGTEPPPPTRVVLDPWVRIRLLVLDEHGRPVSGLRAGARTRSNPFGKAYATTGDDGRATLDVGTDDTYEVFLLDPEGGAWQPTALRRDVRPGDAEIVVTVRESDRPTTRIVGRVALPDGEILPEDVLVSAGRGQDRIAVSLVLHADTGRFESPRLQPGTYQVTLRAPGWGDVPLARVRVTREPTIDIGTLSLERPGSLVVRVHGPADALRVGMSVRAENERGVVWARADEDGLVRFHKIVPGAYAVVLEGAFWAIPPSGAAHADVDVVSGGETTVDLRVATGYVRRIRIDGLPDLETGAVVEVRAKGTSAVLARRVFHAGMDRRPSWDSEVALAPGSYVVEAELADGYRGSAEFDVRGPDEPDVVVRRR